MQLNATKEKTVEEILAGMQSEQSEAIVPPDEGKKEDGVTTKRPRRRRQKMRSTPVVGGGLFNETDHDDDDKREGKSKRKAQGGSDWKPDFNFGRKGHRAEIIVHGESYNVRINDQTLNALRTGFSGDDLKLSGIQIQPDSATVVNQLAGFVRNRPLAQISEDSTLGGESDAGGESDSDTSSLHLGHGKKDDSPV